MVVMRLYSGMGSVNIGEELRGHWLVENGEIEETKTETLNAM